MHINLFDFELPKELIAYHPANPRDSSSMLVVDRENILDEQFKNIAEYLNPNDLVIFNNTKVIPAKLSGICGNNNFDMNLHKKVSDNIWRVFAKKTKKLKVGDQIEFKSVTAKIISIDHGELLLEFSANITEELLKEIGQMPLPPYIKRESTNLDESSYQTIFAKHPGSVAAPTASLHFTKEIFAEFDQRNIQYDFLTLHIGAGTFLPVKTENIDEHIMHSEYCELSAETAELINLTKKKGGRIVAVGTTALRSLEYIAKNNVNLQKFVGENDLFITPGFEFKIVDMLLTNFHLPKTTLFMLVSAFSGLENIKKAYSYAIEKKYRFFSYGDCCLLNRF